MKIFDFIDYGKAPRINLIEAISQLDHVVEQINLPRERSIYLHLALHQLEEITKEQNGRSTEEETGHN